RVMLNVFIFQVRHDTVMAEELKKQIRSIGNNVNQVVHMLHTSRDYANRDYYQHLKTQIDVLQGVVEEHRKQPPKLRQQLECLFAQVPESIDDFQRFLDQMKIKYVGDDH
ncbi:MAG: plasmid mobilization relaxosome protein MobC, partial [Bacteroidota bacterium]